MDPADQLLTIGDVMRILGVGRSTVDRYRAAGDLVAVKLGRGVNAPVRFRLSDVQALLQPDQTGASHDA